MYLYRSNVNLRCIRSLHGIYRVYTSCSTATPLSNQQWRDVLLGALSLGDNTALSRTLEQVTGIFANALENLSNFN